MGVSAEAANLDLNAIAAGGSEFIKRIADFNAAKETAEKAYADLALGKAAQDAYDQAAKVLADAKSKRDADNAACDADLAARRASTEEWVLNTKAAAQAALDEARAKAAEAEANRRATQAALDDAKASQSAANAALKDAQDKAAQIISDASASVDKAKKDADAATKDAAATMADALTIKRKYTDALNKLQGLISATG